MQMTRTFRAPSDRTLNRLMAGMALILVIGIPLIGVLYFFDQYRSPGLSLPDRAVQAAEEAVRANPNSVNARFALAQLYAGKSRYSDAIGQYDEILKAQPSAIGVLLGRASAETAMSNTDAAVADYQAVVDQLKGSEMANTDSNLEAAYYQLGAIALQRGDAKGAITFLTNATHINRTDADALSLLGTALIKTGDALSGIGMLNQAIELVPTGWCDPYQALGQAYASIGDAAGAAYANGMVAFCGKRYDEAKAQLDGLVGGPHALDALVGLGLLAEEQADDASAAAAYTRALALDPKNFLATTGLGRVNAATAPAASSAASGAPQASPSAAASGGN